MIKSLLKKLKTKSQKNERGSVLAVSLIVMVVLTASVTAITGLSIDQSVQTSLKQDAVVDEVKAKRLIQLAISEFEDHIRINEDFDLYENTMIPAALADYDVTVTDVTGTNTAAGDFTDFGVTTEGESRAYRFAYTLEDGKVLVMYSYVSTTGSTIQQFNPFDFTLGTNGDLILSGGFYRDSSFFAENVYFNYRAPYIYNDTTPQTTPNSSGSYPDFNGGGNNADVYFRGEYQYCTGNCFDTGTVNDPFEFQRSEFIDIAGSGLETGDYTQDTIISDFFGAFDYEATVVDYVKNDGPTENDVITDAMTLATMATVVAANASPAGEECFTFPWWGTICWPVESPDPYTDVTNDTNFTPQTSSETLRYSAYYDGDLVINEDFTFNDREDDSIFIDGDLTFNNNGTIFVDGTFVVTGDLYFTGDEIDIDGAFYVLGQTFFDFNYGEGVSEQGDTSQYGLTIMAQDNIIVKSMWASNTTAANIRNNSTNIPQFDTFWYTEESIYIETVNNRMNVDGVLFANAEGVSGNTIPFVDELGNPIHGLVISSYRGYINSSGNAVPANRVRNNAFYLDDVSNVNLQNAFIEIPIFDSLIVTEGVYTFETSEFRYE